MKKRRIRKIVKITLISLGSTILFLIAAIALILNFYLTPARLTPIVQNLAQDYVSTELGIGKVELTFFSTFPRFTVEIDSLYIRNVQDSSANFIAAQKCLLTVSPIAFFADHIKINELLLQRAEVNLLVDSTVKPMDYFILEPSVDDDTTSFSLGDYRISVDKVLMEGADIIVDDRFNSFYSELEDLNIGLSFNMSQKEVLFDLNLALNDVLVNHLDSELAKNTSILLDADLSYNRDSLCLNISRGDLQVNGIDFSSSGVLQFDSLSNEIGVELKGELKTSSLAELVKLVPSSILAKKDDIKASGKIVLEVDVMGKYGDSIMPDVRAHILIDKAKGSIASRRINLNNLGCNLTAYLNPAELDKAYVDIKKFNVQSTNIVDLSLNGVVRNFIEDPNFDVGILLDVDFGKLSELFLHNSGLYVGGNSRSDLDVQFLLSNLTNSNYGLLHLQGESYFDKLVVNVDQKLLSGDSTSVGKMSVNVDSVKMLFGDRVREDATRTLLCELSFKGVEYEDTDGYFAKLNQFGVVGGINFLAKTKEINGLGARLQIMDVNAGIEGQLELKSMFCDATLSYIPKTKNRNAKIITKISSDLIKVDDPRNESFFQLKDVKGDLELLNARKQKWEMLGSIAFDEFSLFSDLFPVDIALQETEVKVDRNKIILSNADLSMGNTHIIASGEIKNLLKVMFRRPNAKMSGNLTLSAPKIDVVELIGAMNQSVLLSQAPQAETTAKKVDTTLLESGTAMILVPQNINFKFNLDIDTVILDSGVEITDLIGQASINKGVVGLDNLFLKTIGAQANASIIYRNLNATESILEMDLNLKSVDINRIGELVPSMDSILPMMNSFEGIVDMGLTANAHFNEQMELDLPSMQAAMSLVGHDLVLLDSETFALISKMLLFKNKKRNIIDSMGLYIIAKESTVEVLPFEVTIDRYVAIIGGSQTVSSDFDLNYDYNISIMRSPLIFKAGVDIFGDMNDWDFRITKAKLKKVDFAEQTQRFNEYCREIVQVQANATAASALFAKVLKAANKASREQIEQKANKAKKEEEDAVIKKGE